MAIKRTLLGHNPDGSPHFHYDLGDGHAVLTGPHYGEHELSDGTVYDVTDPVIEVASPEHGAELTEKLAKLSQPQKEQAPDATDATKEGE